MSEFHGQMGLGYKTASTQQDSKLGDEWDAPVMRWDAANDMWVSDNSGRVRVKWVQNTNGSALKPGSIVTRDAAGEMDINVTACDASKQPCGIVDPFLTEDVADDERFLIVLQASKIQVLSGAAFTKNAVLTSNAAGKAVTGTPAFQHIRALEAATAADQLKYVACNFAAL